MWLSESCRILLCGLCRPETDYYWIINVRSVPAKVWILVVWKIKFKVNRSCNCTYDGVKQRWQVYLWLVGVIVGGGRRNDDDCCCSDSRQLRAWGPTPIIFISSDLLARRRLSPRTLSNDSSTVCSLLNRADDGCVWQHWSASDDGDYKWF